MTQMSIFGWPVSTHEAWLMPGVFGAALLWSGYELRKSLKFGRIGFKGRDYSRDEARLIYRFYFGLWLLLFFGAMAALAGWYFDLGMHP